MTHARNWYTWEKHNDDIQSEIQRVWQKQQMLRSVGHKTANAEECWARDTRHCQVGASTLLSLLGKSARNPIQNKVPRHCKSQWEDSLCIAINVTAMARNWSTGHAFLPESPALYTATAATLTSAAGSGGVNARPFRDVQGSEGLRGHKTYYWGHILYWDTLKYQH